MPDKDPHNKPLVSAALIRQYLAGELDDKAMHDLERQALDDPFLADALEGYGMHHPDQQSAQDELTARLAARVAPRKTIVRSMYTRWAAAAAVLLLLFTGGWFLFREQPDKAPIASADLPPAIPQANPEHAAKDTAPAGNNADNNMLADVQTERADAVKPVTAPSGKTKELAYAPKTAKKTAPPVAADVTNDDRVMYSQKAEVQDVKQEPAPALAAVPAPVKQPSPVATPPAEEHSKELSEVVVTRSRKKETVSAYGAAKPDSLAGVLGSRANGVMLSDRERKNAGQANALPAPVAGYIAYNKYLLAHTNNPDNQFNGTVRISFDVMTDSSLQRFTVVKGLNAACDAEAIRVVKEGPAWKPAQDGMPAKVEVEVVFKVKEN